MFLTFEDTMGHTVTETGEIENIIDITMAQQYNLNDALNRFGGNGGHTVS